MTKFKKAKLILSTALCLSTTVVFAQAKATDTTFRPHGALSGYAFGDFYYKAHADAQKRGGGNQYTGIPKGRNAFQFRRVYLGYDYQISPKFSAQVLLDAESDGNRNYTFYIKYANLMWHHILPQTDLIIGQTSTPAFSHSSEKFWGYRSIEKTIVDKHGTPSYDLGIKIAGIFDPKGQFGYELMVGNNRGAKLENNNLKRFYGDLYGLFLNKRLRIDLYGDYYRLNWESSFHHSRAMGKLFIGYTTPGVTFGIESFVSRFQNDILAKKSTTAKLDTLSGIATGLSVFIRGPLINDKLGFFARTDFYNPNIDIKTQHYTNYQSLSSNYRPTTKGQFITAGLDFTPFKKVHFLPNVWYNHYANQGISDLNRDYDLVYRFTFYFSY